MNSEKTVLYNEREIKVTFATLCANGIEITRRFDVGEKPFAEIVTLGVNETMAIFKEAFRSNFVEPADGFVMIDVKIAYWDCLDDDDTPTNDFSTSSIVCKAEELEITRLAQAVGNRFMTMARKLGVAE